LDHELQSEKLRGWAGPPEETTLLAGPAAAEELLAALWEFQSTVVCAAQVLKEKL
jgi:hypothetical protein